MIIDTLFGTPIDVFISYCESVDTQYMLKRIILYMNQQEKQIPLCCCGGECKKIFLLSVEQI